MRYQFAISTICLLLTTHYLTGAILIQEGFEEEPEDRTFTTEGEFAHTESGQGKDYSYRFGGPNDPFTIPSYTGFTGTYFWSMEDNDSQFNPAGSYSRLIWSNLSLEGWDSLTFSLDVGAGATDSFENDYLTVQYRIDSGSWIDILRFEPTPANALALDSNLDGIGDGADLGLELETFQTNLTGISGTTLDVRIEGVFTTGNETVAFDQFQVTAIPEPETLTSLIALSTILFLRKRIYSTKLVE